MFWHFLDLLLNKCSQMSRQSFGCRAPNFDSRSPIGPEWFVLRQILGVLTSWNKAKCCEAARFSTRLHLRVDGDDPSHVTACHTSPPSLWLRTLSRPGKCQVSFECISRFSRPASKSCLFTCLHWLSISPVSFPSMWQVVMRWKDSPRSQQKPCLFLP